VDAAPLVERETSDGSHGVSLLTGVGSCSTRPSATGDTGVDTLRLLFTTREPVGVAADLAPGWKMGGFPWLHLTWVEGHPLPGLLAAPGDVLRAGGEVRALVDDLVGVRADGGVGRLDVTTTRTFHTDQEGRAFLAGMAALELPRCDAVRRGSQPHSVAWVHERGKRILGRAYDKGRQLGGEWGESIRLETQERWNASKGRPPIEVAADPAYQRSKLARRFAPMRASARGVRAASFPVVARAIADEVRYGYRDVREAERLVGSLVLLSNGAGDGYPRRTRYRRRAELREAGYVVVEDWMAPVEVNLGDELDRALAELT